jgi:hypothetical protein
MVASLATGLIVLDSSMGALRRIVVIALLIGLVSALAILEARGRTRSVAILGSVAGVLGLSVASGYAVSHVLEADVAAAVVGVVGAAGWLVTLIIGLVVLVRSSSWRGRGILVVVALAVAQFGVLPITAGTAGSHPPRIALTSPAPAGAEEVTFPARDGVPISGWYTPGTNGAALVLLPGSGGSREGVAVHAAVLSQTGYTVLALDARGSGTSGGIGNLWGWYGLDDAGGAIDWLERQPGVDPTRIGLLGESMGGEQAVTVASLDHRVRAVIAEGVQGRVPADTWYVGDDPRALVQRTISAIMWGTAAAWSEVGMPPPLRDVVSSLGAPTLIIAADAPDERAVAADLAARSPAIQVWQTTGIGHTEALARAADEWERRVTAFLADSL